MLWYRNLRMVPKIVLPVGAVLILALGVLTWQIQSRSSQAISNVAEREIAALGGQYGNAIQAFFEVAVDEGLAVAHVLAGMIQDGSMPSRAAVLSMIKGVAAGNERFFAVGAAFEPNGFDGMDVTARGDSGSDAKGRFIPYLARGAEITTLSNFSDNAAYYSQSKTSKRPQITEPYTDSVNGKNVLMTTVSSPIIVDGTFKGVMLVDLSIDTVSKIVADIQVYKTGVAAVMTQSGVIVADTNPALVNKNMFTEMRDSLEDPEALQKAFREGLPYAEVVQRGKESTVDYYYPISFRDTGQYWYVVISAPLAEVLEEATFISQLTIGMSAVALVLVLLLIFFVVRSSARPIGVLADAAREIAAGRLDTPIHDEHFGGEVKDLSTTLRNMIRTLLENIEKAQALSEDAKAQAAKAEEAMRNAEEASRDASAKTASMLKTAERLEEVAQIVSSASSQLSAQIEQSERGAMEQASRVTETATAMEEMNSTVLEVARNAGAASDVSGSTRKKAEEGADVVRKAVSSIGTVQQQSQTLKADMTLLDENARAISHIMGVISDIADQTNLLALNAAIEAARAGEAGRGFAVVADEVRKLAEKTMMSTNDVSKAIQAIQASASKSMAQVDTTVGTIAEASALAEQSGAALQEIVALAEHTADQVRAIATAAEQQSASSEEINLSISQVNSIASETARAMQEAANAVSDLAAQAQALTTLIVDMKKG